MLSRERPNGAASPVLQGRSSTARYLTPRASISFPYTIVSHDSFRISCFFIIFSFDIALAYHRELW